MKGATATIDWNACTYDDALVYLRSLGWPVRSTARGVVLAVGASRDDFAVVAYDGPVGRDELDLLQATHPSEPTITGPWWGTPKTRLIIVRQGVKPYSSCELGEHVRLIAHGEIPIPPTVSDNIFLTWRPGGDPSSATPSVLPGWLADAAESAKRRKGLPQAEEDWASQLARNNNKQRDPKSTFANVCIVLRNAEEFRTLRFNEMTLSPELHGRALDDADLGIVRERIERQYLFAPASESLAHALVTVSSERKYHPVREYLEGLKWDGKRRLDRVAPDILGAESTPINRACLRAWFISAVARALKPGCKVDTCLILIGPQGMYKSTFFSILGGAWFSDTAIDLDSKDAMQQVNHAWIYEFGELDQITSKAHAGRIKAFISSQVDKYRPPYGKSVVSVPRGNVIVGSTNEDQFLADPTGARRFWCVRVPGRIDRDALTMSRDQLWAEALEAYRANEQWWLAGDAEKAQAAAADDHAIEHPWTPKIIDWLETAEGPVTTARVLSAALNVETAKHTQQLSVIVGTIMRKLKYANRVEKVGKVAQRVWHRERLQGYEVTPVTEVPEVPF